MTTLGVNVGDEFIREGICSFIDEIFDSWTPFYVNKHNLLTLHERVAGEAEVLKDKFYDADIIIQSGAPVYWKLGEATSCNVEWAEELWGKRIFKLGSEKPVLNIAAGACQPYPDFAKTFLSDPQCVEFARKVAIASCWTSVRDPLASQILYALGIKHEVLPCAAFHAARRVKTKYENTNVVGINLMPFGGHYKLKDDIDTDVWKEKIEAFLPEVRKYHKLLFIAHDHVEVEFMRQFIQKDETVFYSSNYCDYLPVYAGCAAVIANRVHGAVCAAGFGVPSIIIGNDTRLMIGDFIGIPSRYVSAVSGDEIMELLEANLAGRKREKDRLLTLREESALRYIESITKALDNFYSAPEKVLVKKTKKVSLASVDELSSILFRDFMATMNCFARRFNLHQFTNCSRVWEYPWLWFNCLSGIDWTKTRLLDIGSELSPMPWFLASFGASVTLVESNPQWIPGWEQIQRETGLNVDWHIVKSEILPFADSSFDVVASFSVIEHQPDKLLAVNEVARVLKQEGLFAVSFDLSEPDMGMTFPDWNGKALTMKEFEELVWHHPHFDNKGQAPEGNTEDIPEFINWHLQSAPHHNYIAGAGILKKKLIIPDNIRKILLPRFDTIGDIVLLEGFLEALIEKFPRAEITLLVREGYEQLAPLFPEKLRWLTTPINPYKNPDEKGLEKLTELSGKIADASCDLLLTTTYNRTWLDDVVAAMMPDALKIAVGVAEETDRIQGFLKILKTEVQRLYSKVVPVDEHLHETEKYQILWDNLFKDDIKLSLPRLSISAELKNRMPAILTELGLEDKKFFVCVPAGNQNIPAKVWPAEHFAEAVLWITREFGFHPLIVCHESERAIVSALSKKLEEKGVGFHTWMGKDGELPILAGLMKKARFYLGNDTGPMHIAAAAGIPVAGIFGGGTWPRFLPLGPHSIGLAGKLPCFGCYWDCIFGDAPCIRLVTVYDVQKAIRRILKEDRVETNRMYASKNISKETAQYIEKAAARFKICTADSAARLQESEANSAARLEAILERDKRLQESEVNSAARLEAILERDKRLQAMDRKLEVSEKQVQKLIRATALLPLVSVITPVFNGERWIENCIKSVLQQDYPHIEHIIVDGGSTDGTLDICRKYSDLILHSKKDRGQSHAINKGFAMARGEILAWLCADDEYEAGAVEAAVKGILAGHKVVMGYSRFIDAEGNLISEHPANTFPYYNHDMFLRFWQYNPVSQPAIFWTRGMWEACGPLRENLNFAMDYDLWLRMSRKTRFERVDAYLAKYRIHPDAKCFADNYGSRIELINVSRQYWPSRWKPDYWRLRLNYKTSSGAITQHYADAEKLLSSTVACLNSGKRFNAVTAFVRAHLRHFAAPLMPGYPLISKRILGEGIGPLWLWSLMKRFYERIKLKMSKYFQ